MAFFMGLANGVMTRVMNGLLGVIGMELAGEGEWNWDGDGDGTESTVGTGIRVSLFGLRLLISLPIIPYNSNSIKPVFSLSFTQETKATKLERAMWIQIESCDLGMFSAFLS